MKRRGFLVFGATVALALAASGADDLKLTVQVTYAGSGTVDDSHKVFVVIWDTPEFVKEGSELVPIAVKTISSKKGSAQFDDIQKSPAYVSMVYDPSGKWEAMSAPPAGSSLGLYAKEDGAPAPVMLEAGKTGKVEATFDDSFKMK